jgi:hypothetical protein
MRRLATALFSLCLIGGAAAEQAPVEGASPMAKSEDISPVVKDVIEKRDRSLLQNHSR